MFAGATLAAHKAAGDASGGVELFFKLDAQGEEIHAFAGLVAHHNVAQHAGFAVADHGAAVGQTAHLAGFDHKGATCKGRFKFAVLGEGFQPGCKFVSHRDSPSCWVDLYRGRAAPTCTINPTAESLSSGSIYCTKQGIAP